ncbi:hypothetical protein D9756_002333 [Leucocoprinus leucothites]|uniref:Uncharacterized protein n=1 Tax=Leucocoprinus leucothites TaxID=201217 RepID=A0A8H5GCB5_9AGAR|nr:hypothetical protein D9756_002333 [Leucoagaricus leucothites]
MEPRLPGLPTPGLPAENPQQIVISEEQQIFLQAAYPPIPFYPWHPYGAPYTPTVAVTQLVHAPSYFMFPGPYPYPPIQSYLHAQPVDTNASALACGFPFHCIPLAIDADNAQVLAYPVAQALQNHGVAPAPTTGESLPLAQLSSSSSSTSGINTSMSSNTNSETSSSQAASQTRKPSPSSSTSKISFAPSSPPGPAGTGKPSSNDPRHSDLLQSIAQTQNLAYIPRKRPIIPDLLYIPRLVGQSNFKEWDELIQTLLIQMRLYDHIHNPKQKPHINGITPSYPPAVHSMFSKEEKQRSTDWWANDACVKMILSMRLSKPILQMVLCWEGGDTAREMYKLLWRTYGPPSSNREERLSVVDK